MAKRESARSASLKVSKSSSSKPKSAKANGESSRHGKPSAKSARSSGGRSAPLTDDWDAFKRLSDAEVKKRALADRDVQPTARGFWKDAKVVWPQPKQLTALRIDPDVLGWFKAQGKGYQTRMNAVLRAYMKAQSR